MKRKTLQDVANTLPDMLVGWRMAEDLDRLSDLPDGTLRIDLLRETAEHSGAGPITLHVVAELTAWLRDRLTALEIPLTELTHANVDAEIRTNRIATDRKRIVSFDFTCQSRLVTLQRTYEATLQERHVWHRRSAPDKRLERPGG